MATQMHVTIDGDVTGSQAKLVLVSNTGIELQVIKTFNYNQQDTINKSDVKFSGYDPIQGYVTSTVIRFYPIAPASLTSVTSDYGYDPITGTTLTFSATSGGTYSATITPDHIGDGATKSISITPSVSGLSVPETLDITVNNTEGHITAFLARNVVTNVVQNIPLNTTITVDDATIPQGSSDSYYLYIVRAEGYQIESIDNNWIYDPTTGTSVAFLEESPGVFSAQLTYNHLLAAQNLVVDVTTIAEPISASPFNRVYLLSKDKLEAIGAVQINTTDEFGNKIERGKSIINLMEFPFEIDATVYAPESAEVRIADLGTNITAPVINTEKISIDLGEMSVDDTLGSSEDFVASTYELVVPYINGPFTLPASRVVGKTVRAEIVLDPYSGDTTVNVYEGADTVPFLSEKADVGRHIPFRTEDDIERSMGNVRGVVNGVLTAYIRHTKKELQAGRFSNLVEVDGVVGDVSEGFVIVDEIDLNVNATLSEKLEIQQILKGGVNIRP